VFPLRPLTLWILLVLEAVWLAFVAWVEYTTLHLGQAPFRIGIADIMQTWAAPAIAFAVMAYVVDRAIDRQGR
jgi:hypothetical protein